MSKTIKCQKSMRSTLICPLSNAITTAYNLSTDFITVNVQTLIGILERVPTEKVLRRILGRIWLDSWKVIAIIMHNAMRQSRTTVTRALRARMRICGYVTLPHHDVSRAHALFGMALVWSKSRESLRGRAEEVGHDHVRTKNGRVAPYITLYKM